MTQEQEYASIGKFMGHSVSTFGGSTPRYGYYGHDGFYPYNYAEDWNILMSIIDHIEELGSYEIMQRKVYNPIEFSRYGFKLYFHKDDKSLLHLQLLGAVNEDTWKHSMYRDHIIKAYPKGATKIEIVYLGIVEFIKWYNKNL